MPRRDSNDRPARAIEAPTRRRPDRRRVVRAAAAVLAALAFAGLSGELALRSALFGDGVLARRLGPRVRRPAWYADGRYDAAYWKLRYVFDPDGFGPAPGFDPEIGWCGKRLSPDTLALSGPSPRVGSRKPVLLFGDSFAECTTAREECFEWLFERSALGERFALLNFGVGGFGLDQTYLLMRRALETLPFGRPIVIVSVLVDSDLDRTVLAFRDWPKPRFRLESGSADGLHAPDPVAPSAAAHLAARPLDITSYAWRYLLHGSGLLPDRLARRLTDEARAAETIRALTRRLVARTRAELEARDLRYFFLVFNGRESFEQGELHSWREPFLRELLGELDIPYVTTRRDIQADARRRGASWRDYFTWEGPTLGHYNALGNAVAFRAIERAFRGEFEGRSDRRDE